MAGHEIEDRRLACPLLGHLPSLSWPSLSLTSARRKSSLTSGACMIMHYSVNTIPVGVLGASGYAGRELCALVARHPRFALAFATANEQRGQSVRLGGRDVTFQASDDVDLSQAGVVFSEIGRASCRERV